MRKRREKEKKTKENSTLMRVALWLDRTRQPNTPLSSFSFLPSPSSPHLPLPFGLIRHVFSPSQYSIPHFPSFLPSKRSEFPSSPPRLSLFLFFLFLFFFFIFPFSSSRSLRSPLCGTTPHSSFHLVI